MRRRILLAMVVVTAAAVTAFAIPLAITTAARYRSREVSELQQGATVVLRALPDTGLEGGAPIQLPALVGGMTGAVYDSAGRLVDGVGPDVADQVVERALAGETVDGREGDELVVAVPILDENQIVGAIRTAEPWAVVAHDTQRQWMLMTLVGVGAVAAAAGLGAALSRRLVAPIDDLVEVAVRLGDGDFTARVEPGGVAELDRAGVALNSTAGRLAGLLGRERAFAADVSHQLSTPLTALRLDLEEATLHPEHDSRAVLDRSIGEVDRLQTTIETLLAVARDSPLTGGTTDLTLLCNDIDNTFAPRFAASDRSLVVDVDTDVPLARCAPQVLREIVTVLVDNALVHGAGTVTITVRRRGTGAAIAVGDEGAGVSPERADRIFVRRDSSAVGHGIGLSLARSLAEAHDLRLELTRRADGPVFTVACPGIREPAGVTR